jgi:hypothetical protein
MIQCDKLLGLGLAERRDVLEKSGLCTFCLKHSAEFECYGRGGCPNPDAPVADVMGSTHPMCTC